MKTCLCFCAVVQLLLPSLPAVLHFNGNSPPLPADAGSSPSWSPCAPLSHYSTLRVSRNHDNRDHQSEGGCRMMDVALLVSMMLISHEFNLLRSNTGSTLGCFDYNPSSLSLKRRKLIKTIFKNGSNLKFKHKKN